MYNAELRLLEYLLTLGELASGCVSFNLYQLSIEKLEGLVCVSNKCRRCSTTILKSILEQILSSILNRIRIK